MLVAFANVVRAVDEEKSREFMVAGCGEEMKSECCEPCRDARSSATERRSSGRPESELLGYLGGGPPCCCCREMGMLVRLGVLLHRDVALSRPVPDDRMDGMLWFRCWFVWLFRTDSPREAMPDDGRRPAVAGGNQLLFWVAGARAVIAVARGVGKDCCIEVKSPRGTHIKEQIK